MARDPINTDISKMSELEFRMVIIKILARDAWVAQLVKQLPLAQVMIPASWDRVPHRAPCSAGSLLLPLPGSLSACAHSL